jgi:hypothetical protein
MRCESTDDLVDDLSYPVTTTELLAAHGDHVIRLADGTERMTDVLSRLGEETYEAPSDLRDAILTGVGHEAIGRRYYSDRDAYALGESGRDQVSF